MSRIPSPDEIMAAKGENGYWPKEKLQEWGVPTDPVPARWRETLERQWYEQNIPDDVRELLRGAGYDDEGIEAAWRSTWWGMGRMRMFEEYWKDPQRVLDTLGFQTRETVLEHPHGGELVLRYPMDALVAGQTLKALGELGWQAR